MPDTDLDKKDRSTTVVLAGSDSVGSETELAQIDLVNTHRRLVTRSSLVSEGASPVAVGVTLANRLMTDILPQHVVDSAGDTYIPGTTYGALAVARVVDYTAPPSLVVGQHTGLTSDDLGNLLVHVNANTGPGTVPSINTIGAYVQANKVFTAAIQVNMASSAVDNPLLLIRNPALSGKVMYLYKIIVACSVANTSAVFKYIVDGTVTAVGAAYTPANNNVGGPSPATAMLVTTLPTITAATGTVMSSMTYGQNSNSFTSIDDFSLAINPGHSVAVTGLPTSNNRAATITAIWVEL